MMTYNNKSVIIKSLYYILYKSSNNVDGAP